MIDKDTAEFLLLFSVCVGIVMGLSQSIVLFFVQWYESRQERLGRFDGPEAE